MGLTVFLRTRRSVGGQVVALAVAMDVENRWEAYRAIPMDGGLMGLTSSWKARAWARNCLALVLPIGRSWLGIHAASFTSPMAVLGLKPRSSGRLSCQVQRLLY